MATKKAQRTDRVDRKRRMPKHKVSIGKSSTSAAGNTDKYAALKFAQRPDEDSPLVIFHARAKDILSWSEVGVLGPDTTGHQRERLDAKVRAISKFFNADRRNVIPTAVVLAFSKGATTFEIGPDGTCGILAIVRNKTSSNIVDGQHRVYGMNDFDPDAQIPVVGLLDADAVEKAFQFLVINNKSTRVPATHAKALLAKMESTKLADRLRAARLAFDVKGIRDVDILNSDKDSPFHKMIDWSITDASSRAVQATAIESSLAYIGNLSVPEFEDRDVRRAVFASIWRSIRTAWPELWKQDSRLLSKVGVVCLTRFVVDMITSWADSDELDIDLLDLDEIDRLTKNILRYLDQRFWTQPWAQTASGGFDTNQGRDRVIKALTQLYRNGKRGVEWSVDIEIVEPAPK